MRRLAPLLWPLVLALAPGPSAAIWASEPVIVGRFAPPLEPDGLPEGWQALTFKKIPRHTRYTVVRVDDAYVLKAESRAAASGLYHPLDLDPRIYQILSWRWKVENVLVKADARRREGDDYPARIYVAFRYDPDGSSLWEKARYGAYRLLYGRYPPEHVLNYVWDNRLPPGTVLDNAYTRRAKMIVVRSGATELGRWLTETRNIYEDYRRILGAEPPRIEGVALMTDTDDTGESAVAYYDAITLRSIEPPLGR